MNVSDRELQARAVIVLRVLKKQYLQEHGLNDDFVGLLQFHMAPKQGLT